MSRAWTLTGLLFLSAILPWGAAGAAENEIAHLTGNGAGDSTAFNVEAPWLLRWRMTGEFPAYCRVELRLYNDETGDFVGRIASAAGPSSGERLLRQGGRYHVTASAVLGCNVDWQVTVVKVDQAEADRLTKKPDSDRPQDPFSNFPGRR